MHWILAFLMVPLLVLGEEPPTMNYFDKIRAGDITFHQHGWPENTSIEFTQEIWADQEEKMKAMLEGVIKPVFPALLRAGSESEISPECQASMLKMILAVRAFKTWAMHMIDSSGKLPNGIFAGTSATFGHFDQCLRIQQGELEDGGFRGKYCYVKTTAPNLPRPVLNSTMIVTNEDSILNWFYSNAYWIQQFGSRMGVCMPSLCTDEDVSKLITYVFSSINASSKVIDCYEEETWNIDRIQRIVIWSLVALVAVGVFCTTYDLFTNSENQSATRPTSSTMHKLILNFSLVQNSKRLFRISKSKRDIGALHVIRTISYAWIVIGHIYFLTDIDSFARFGSLGKLEDLFTSFLFTAVENFSLPVDTFFAITGLLIVWTSQNGGLSKRFTCRSWTSNILHRIYRIYPCYLLMHGLFLLAPALGQGPIWKETFAMLTRNMYTTGWMDLLFVNNFIHWTQNAMVHTWFIAVNIQFCIIGVPLANLLRKKPRVAITLMTVISLLGCVVNTALIHVNRYPPSMLMMTAQYDNALDYITYVYYMPTTHFGPFCMGLILGYLVVEGFAPKFSTALRVLGNLVALGLMFIAVFGCFPFRAGWNIDYAWMSLYGGFHRIIWTLGVCWFIFCAMTGQGGVIAALLSADFFQPFSALSFTVYLLHPLPIQLYVAFTKEIQQLDHFYMAIFFLGVWTAAHMIAYFAHIMVELPFAGLEKFWRERHRPDETLNNCSHKNTPVKTYNGTTPARAEISHVAIRMPSTTASNFDAGIVTKYKF